jgi:hypothetical protein
MSWRGRTDLWNGVVEIRHSSSSEAPTFFVAFFIVAASSEAAARKLFVELLDRGWSLVSFVNLQSAPQIDDEAAEYLAPMALLAEQDAVSFSDFPSAKTQ